MSNVTEITASSFDALIENEKKAVLIDFYAPWCGPCKMIAPLVDEIAKERDDLKVVKINADEAQELMVKFGIRGIPTLLLFNQGELVASKVGAVSLGQLREFTTQV